MNRLVPINDCVLVELSTSPYGDIPIPEKKYDSRTEGVVIEVYVNETDRAEVEALVGKTVFWEEYKDSTRAERDGKTYAFIKYEDIRGYEAN